MGLFFIGDILDSAVFPRERTKDRFLKFLKTSMLLLGAIAIFLELTKGLTWAALRGLQHISVNFWQNPGIVTLFDSDGNILAQDEPTHSGSPMLPVNWRGDGQEFCLLSGNVREGGMIDGLLRRVVMFPDDGHPDLAAAVLDLTGDQRDEIVLWDQSRVWIYTQDRPFEGRRMYAPIRNPDYNDSNYRIAARAIEESAIAAKA